MAAHLISSLRIVHNSSIPIEIAYAGDEDLKPEDQKFLRELSTNVSLINLLDFFPNAKYDLVKSEWAMKPISMLASKSRGNILVDADTVFLISPESLFERNLGLMRTGTLLYHDRAIKAGDRGGADLTITCPICSVGHDLDH